MKPLNLQSDLRKNPDSPRVRALRPSVDSLPEELRDRKSAKDEAPPPTSTPRIVKAFELPLSDQPNETTAELGCGSACLLTVEEVATLLHVPVSWVYGRMRKRSLDRLPGYRLGKYWRFRGDEIHAWLKRRGGGRGGSA